MFTRLRLYLVPSQAKILIWLAFLGVYLLGAAFVSGKLPSFFENILRQTIFTSTMIAWPNEPKRVYLLGGSTRSTNPYVLFFSYTLVTYLWACIFVESFGTIYPRVGEGLRQRRQGILRRKRTTRSR